MKRPRRAADALTPREGEIAALIAAGLSNREIAEQLVVSVGTVQNHIHRLLKKRSFRSRTQIAALAARNHR